ncbi:MAG: hypothetical protein E6I61_17020, partial [Chloroflexi bacterium]
MIRRNLLDAAQLSNKPSFRRRLSYLYLVLFAVGTLTTNVLWRQGGVSPSDNFIEFFYLLVAVIVLSSIDVRLERGRLNLASIALGTTAILLNPIDATLVGLALGISMARRGLWPLLGNSVMAASYECFGALMATHFRVGETLTLGPRILVLVVVNI